MRPWAVLLDVIPDLVFVPGTGRSAAAVRDQGIATPIALALYEHVFDTGQVEGWRAEQQR
jgi:hypothetical protein